MEMPIEAHPAHWGLETEAFSTQSIRQRDGTLVATANRHYFSQTQ
jgi:hypothetical protein